ncbi:MAG TPA: hypothetical protein VK668_20275 [Mucilaginibacter sp.]|nr:hypothetical protein [Mucilaginibacter sp.]
MKSAYLFLFILCISTLGCKKTKPPKPDYTPSKAVLLTPANNEACYSGTPTSPTESTVLFKWKSASNAGYYELSIKNLETGEIRPPLTISDTQVDVSISQNTPFSWFITAKSSKTAAKNMSDTWKFYNSGAAVKSHAPFPAEIVSPLFDEDIAATSNKITLTWAGSDVDNDISVYDLYFGTTNTPHLLQPNLVPTTNTVNVSSKTTYYWKVITRDLKGNTSDSGLYQFTVN